MANAGNKSDAGNRSKRNSGLMMTRRGRMAKLRELYTESVGAYDGNMVDGKIPHQKLAVIKREIRGTVARKRFMMLLYAFIYFMLILAGFALLLWMSR